MVESDRVDGAGGMKGVLDEAESSSGRILELVVADTVVDNASALLTSLLVRKERRPVRAAPHAAPRA